MCVYELFKVFRVLFRHEVIVILVYVSQRLPVPQYLLSNLYLLHRF